MKTSDRKLYADLQNNACILIVEDNDDDYEACVAALTGDNKLTNPIMRCTTGDGALEYLLSQARLVDTPNKFPCLILLDLNLPGSHGVEVLLAIKSAPALKQIPIVMLSSSQDRVDIDACYRAGANSYIVKPVNLEGFFTTMATFKAYWFQIALLPDSSGRST